MRWDLFCRVIDNYGDIGVCWRLAADLASRGEAVRLWLDDAAPLSWMAPAGAAGVQLQLWSDPAPDPDPGDVVIEAFGCHPPPRFVQRMAARTPQPPLWVNLEYLSAEPYAERCHGLPSPQLSGIGAGLTKWFFFPGFSETSGGLLREPALSTRRAAFDACAWLAGHGLERRPGERVVSLFCYPGAPLSQWVRSLAGSPTLLLVTAGVAAAVEVPTTRGLRCVALPWLTQPDYDHLLWSCDLNLVRGEDSLVRAFWAGAPFVWQAYPQHDGAHAAKLEAFLDRFLHRCPAPFAAALRASWRAWNGLGPWLDSQPDEAAWRSAAARWRDGLSSQRDLTTRLLGFVDARR